MSPPPPSAAIPWGLVFDYDEEGDIQMQAIREEEYGKFVSIFKYCCKN